MVTQAEVQHPERARRQARHLLLRIGRLTGVIYLVLYGCCSSSAIPYILFPLQHWTLPSITNFPPLRNAILWTVTQIVHTKEEIIWQSGASGDKIFDFIQSAWLLMIAFAAGTSWSIFNREQSEAKLYPWFRFFLRMVLGAVLVSYGISKVIPDQMSKPYLIRLVEPFGNFSPMGVLWNSIGAAPAYETFTGLAETIAGVLLLIPRTAQIGAWLALLDACEVFLLNMTYDVPVKLFSFHLVVMALILVMPAARQLAGYFLWNRAAIPCAEAPLFQEKRVNRWAYAAQVIYCFFLLTVNSQQTWHEYTTGSTHPRTDLYGIWDIEELVIDGVARPPLLTDEARLRRAIFDFPDWMAFQRMDEHFDKYDLKMEAERRTLELTGQTEAKRRGQLSYAMPDTNHMRLTGTLDAHAVQMQLRRVDTSRFLLNTRGFHLIQETNLNE